MCVRNGSLGPASCESAQMLHDSDRLAILVIDTWVVGEVRQDHSGWYQLPPARVGIRLSAGRDYPVGAQ
jgi:hypothetical protein